MSRVRRLVLIGVNYARRANQLLPSANQNHVGDRILPQYGRATAEKTASADVLGSSDFLESFAIDIGPL